MHGPWILQHLTMVLLLQEETRKLAEYTDYRMVSVVGGQSIEEQGFKLRKARSLSWPADSLHPLHADSNPWKIILMA